MRNKRQNRGAMRRERGLATLNECDDMPCQHAEKDMRARFSWSAPTFPGAFCHILDVFEQHGTTTLHVCLERHKHIRLTIPLHDVMLTQHPPHDPHAHIKRKDVTPLHRLDVEANMVRRYVNRNECTLIKRGNT
jgi:hypothetical protein